MLKIVENGTSKVDWQLVIDDEFVEKVSFHQDLHTLDLTVSFTETSPLFFKKEILEFYSLLSDKIESLRITIGIKNFLQEESNELFANNASDDSEVGPRFIIYFELEQEDNFTIGELDNFMFMLNPTWKYPFSMLEYYEFVSEYLEAIEAESIFDAFVGRLKFSLPNNVKLEDYLQGFIEKLKIAHQKAFEELSNKVGVNSLTTRFASFPDEVRVPCEQYLLYFTEFLRDLGISATSDIKHQAGEVLFSVTPTNPDQALDRIKIALDAFLSLPKSEIVINPDSEFEIAILKVKANIDHLSSQLSLAKAEIRVKEREIQAFEATLEAKDISIEFLREKLNQQKRLLNGEIAQGIIDIEPKSKDEDKEEFFDGVFALTQYEEKGVRVNLAQLYRKLKIYLKSE